MLPRGWALRHERNYRDKVDVRLPWGVKEELQRIAKQRNITLSELVRLSIEHYLTEHLGSETKDKDKPEAKP